jgi:sugar phosphate isomerase/epimerase
MLEEQPENFKPVMEQLRNFGYDGVELAGTYGLSPEFIRDALGEIGLNPISAHIPLTLMMEDSKKAANECATIGCQYVVIPYLPEEFRHNTPGYERALAEFSRIRHVMQDHGLKLLYHNHDFEFVAMPDGSTGFDDIYKRVPDVLEAEPDTCWIKVAGFNPAALISQYKKRCPIIHLKDFIKEGAPKNMYKLIGLDSNSQCESDGLFEFRAVGFGQQIWLPILEASVQAEAKWAVVEQDEHYSIPSIECARRSREHLKILGW